MSNECGILNDYEALNNLKQYVVVLYEKKGLTIITRKFHGHIEFLCRRLSAESVNTLAM